MTYYVHADASNESDISSPHEELKKSCLVINQQGNETTHLQFFRLTGKDKGQRSTRVSIRNGTRANNSFTMRFPNVHALLMLGSLTAYLESSSALSLDMVERNPMTLWSGRTGESALAQVEYLASKVAESSGDPKINTYKPRNKDVQVAGEGGDVFKVNQENRDNQVWNALASLENDIQLLDKFTGDKPQLTPLELTMLTLSVFAAGSGPFILGGTLTEFLPPTAAAFSAAIGIGAEYVGRVAVADGKEIAAASLQCSAEAESFLANAERSKAITPLCVGIGATATTFALLVPVLMSNLPGDVINELYLCCPLVSVLAAAVSSLALQETRYYSRSATTVGNRRFARSGIVGRSWLSTSEQVAGKSINGRQKWRSFCLSVLPSPIIGAMIPGASFATKAIIVSAIAAAQSAFFLAQCEYCLARAADAVAVKARSAAVCDAYANQGARSAAILPFTSALSGLCAAATAAIVEIPYLETLAAGGGIVGLTSQMVVVAFFPFFSSLFASAASVSKARCEVQAEAAAQAASTLALEYNSNDEDDPVLRPFRGVLELIQLTYTSSIVEPFQRLKRQVTLSKFWQKIFGRKRGGDGNNINTNSPEPQLGVQQ